MSHLRDDASTPKLRRLRSGPALSAGLVLTFVLVACGQKPGVHVQGSDGGVPAAGGAGTAAPTDGGTGLSTEEGSGDAVAGGSGGGSGGGSTSTGGGGDSGGSDGGGSAGTTGGGSGGGQEANDQGGSGGGGGGGEGSGGGKRQPQGQDRTGVTDNKITVGLHAPVTGAAPLPSTSFEEAGDLYWRWETEEKKRPVLGRDTVELIFRDDKYEPSSARQVCRELAAKSFLVAGGGGTDQIQACGQFAGQASVPYFSPGVTEVGLEGNPWYFAGSMTYRQQGVLLGQYVKKNFGKSKVGAILTDTPNFDDAVQGWERGVQQQGIDYYKTLRHPKGDTSWYRSFAQELDENGVETVYILTAPTDYIRFAQQADDQGIDFQYVGVGVSMGLNAVLGAACPDVDDGVFFSPFPALETADDLDPAFNKAADRFGTPDDDIAWALWGSNKQFHALLKRYGKTFGNDLTREDFRALVEQQSSVKTGVFPDVGYSPDNHFGGKQVHVLKADCDTEQYRDAGRFKSGF